jgi:hypothetical protein
MQREENARCSLTALADIDDRYLGDCEITNQWRVSASLDRATCEMAIASDHDFLLRKSYDYRAAASRRHALVSPDSFRREVASSRDVCAANKNGFASAVPRDGSPSAAVWHRKITGKGRGGQDRHNDSNGECGKEFAHGSSPYSRHSRPDT